MYADTVYIPNYKFPSNFRQSFLDDAHINAKQQKNRQNLTKLIQVVFKWISELFVNIYVMPPKTT